MKNWLRIFILCWVCLLTTISFMACATDVNTYQPNDDVTNIGDTTPEAPTTPSEPNTPEEPTIPEQPTQPTEPSTPTEPEDPNTPVEPPVEELPHTHNHTGKVTTEATCTKDGCETFTCECGNTYEEVIPALGHNYILIETVAPTCTTDGYTIRECSHCEDKKQTDQVATTGHQYETIEIPATCVTDGSITTSCACGDTHTEIIPAFGHDYDPDTRQCKHCAGFQSPIENLVNSYWYFVSTSSNKWAFHFNSDRTYVSYAVTIAEDGSCEINKPTVKKSYEGEYFITEKPNQITGIKEYIITFNDDSDDMMSYPEFILTFQEVDGQYQLTGKFKNKDSTFIFGGYEVI